MGEETFAIIPRFASTAPVSSTMTSPEKVYSLSPDQRSPHYLPPLSLHFCRTHGIPLIIQHLQAWRLQPQTLIACEMFAALEVSQNFVVKLSQYRDVLATNTAIEMAGFCRNICGPSHQKLPNIIGRRSFLYLVRHFEPQSSTGLTHVTIIAACGAGVTQLTKSTGRPLLYLLQPAQNIMQSFEQQMYVKERFCE